ARTSLAISVHSGPLHHLPTSPPPLVHAITPTEIYTLSLHDALPILCEPSPNTALRWPLPPSAKSLAPALAPARNAPARSCGERRSEEHTSELQSRENVVCRLLLENINRPPLAHGHADGEPEA